jgi:phage tail-like protein
LPVRHAVARSGEHWPEARLDGLQADPAGDLRLQLLPGLQPASIAAPADPPPSGLALDCRCGLYVSGTATGRIARHGLDCGSELVVPGRVPSPGPGPVPSPAGLCWGPEDWLFAGCGDGRVLTLTTPDLAVRDAWTGFGDPAYLASHRDWVIVVDTQAHKLFRFDARGRPDATFNPALPPPAGDPRGVAVARDGTIYVADAALGGVVVMSWAGVPGAPIAAGTQPRAVAVGGDTLYVSDATSGQVLVLSIPDGQVLGVVGGVDGPVTALAVGKRALFIKTALDDSYLVAPLGSCHRGVGTLTIGPIDAGKQSSWARAEVKAETPALTSVDLAWYTDSTATPALITWTSAPSLDTLIDGDRFLWLQVTGSSREPSISPTISQVAAQTTGDSYLAYLPYVYAHDPDRSALSALTLSQADATQFEPGDLDYLRLLYARAKPQGNDIGRLVDLARSQLGDLESAIDDLPRAFDPATAPAEMLSWLASWLAFDLPPRLLDGTHPDEVRRLLLALATLYRRRSTPRGLADFVEVYSGARPHIFEDFRSRPLWVLDETPLGFGTGMPDRDVEGMLVGDAIVGETGPGDPATIGSALFASTAHLFTVSVPPARGLSWERSLIMQVVESEKPAHTGFHLCFIGPSMRVGVQARVGIDALVSGGPPEMALDERSILGVDAVLAGPEMGAASVGSHGQVGIDMRLS